jgi:hypothetical protein
MAIKTALLVVSCDAYRDVWGPFYAALPRLAGLPVSGFFGGSNHATYPNRRVAMLDGYAAEDAHGTVFTRDRRSGPHGRNADVTASVPNEFGQKLLNCLMILSDGGMEGVDPRSERTGNE